MLNGISASSVPQRVFRLNINALLLVMSASSVMVGLPFFVNKCCLFWSRFVHTENKIQI